MLGVPASQCNSTCAAGRRPLFCGLMASLSSGWRGLLAACALALAGCYAEFENSLTPDDASPLKKVLSGEWRFVDLNPADLARAPRAVPPRFTIAAQPDGSIVASAPPVAGVAVGYEIVVSRVGGRDYISAREQPGLGPWWIFRATWDPAKKRLALEGTPETAIAQLIKAGLLKGKAGKLTSSMVAESGEQVAAFLGTGTLAYQSAFTLQKSGK